MIPDTPAFSGHRLRQRPLSSDDAMHTIADVSDKFMLIVQRSFESLLLDPLAKDLLANIFSQFFVSGAFLCYYGLQFALG